MSFPILLCLWVIQGLLAAHYAKRSKRNPYFWFAIGCLFGVFGILALFFLKPMRKKETPQPIAPVQVNKNLPHRLWYYLDEATQQVGPISTSALEDAWRKKSISLTTYVWNEEMQDWKRWREVCEENGTSLETIS